MYFASFAKLNDKKCQAYASLTLTLPGLSAGVSGYHDSYCSLKPLCSGMGEVVPARTSRTLLPPSPRTVLYPVSKCCSASIVMTSTLRVKNQRTAKSKNNPQDSVYLPEGRFVLVL